MKVLLRLRSAFSESFSKYKNALSPHIYKILSESEAKSETKYLSCLPYFQEAEQSYSEQKLKSKCTMIFNAHCSNDSLSHLKNVLFKLIINDSIKTQYELDQILKWLIKDIKTNNAIGEQEIILQLNNRDKHLLQFQQELKSISKNKEYKSLDIQQLCKIFRDKYITIDSKVIFEKIKEALKSSKNNENKKNEHKFWDKINNIKPRFLKQEQNDKLVSQEHDRITGGKLRFRFPPQPNGYLHIGHVKAIRINFQTPKRLHGTCYLRYDDTNPEKQTHQFIQEIEDNVKWLGYTPDKITFASDYFEQMIGYANQLIKDGHAYVCDTPQQQFQEERKNQKSNPYRDRSIEENLKMFPNLQYFQTLRLKGDPKASNPTLRDPVIFRRKDHPHPRTGSKYKIYPIYDFAHCTSDSIEHIDYSLCTLEFQIRRELYYRYLHLLNIFKPTVWEYSRLNVEGNILSKRKIKDLIEKKAVKGWDDPRLLTVRGLKNRGYTASMLIRFVDKVNSSRAGNQNYVQYSLLERQMKKELLATSPKTMAVIQPQTVIIRNSKLRSLKIEVYPKAESQTVDQKPKTEKKQEFRQATIEKKIYIEKTEADQFQLNTILILKYAGLYKVVSVKNETVNQIQIEHIDSQTIEQKRKLNPKMKILHWISEQDSITTKITIFDRLLLQDNQLNPSSELVYENSRVPKDLSTSNHPYWQFQRIGFFKFASEDKDHLICCTKL